LGDVNLFHGRAHEGEVHLEGLRLQAPEHADAQDAKAYAYVRPHDLEVARYQPGQATGRDGGIVARLVRAIVVGPIARLELVTVDDSRAPSEAGSDSVIEAQIPAQQYRDAGFREGDTLWVTPRKARIFLEG
jgi:sulfate transport system ATP-binding protein